MMTVEHIAKLEGRKGEVWGSLMQVVKLARDMSPKNDDGEWGNFVYDRVRGTGALYVPFGADGIATTFLSCGGEIGENNLKEAMLTGVFAAWSGRVGNKVMMMAAVLLPYRKMTEDRLFAYYLQGMGERVILDAYGSPEIGWRSVSPYALPLTGVEVAGVRLKSEISCKGLLANLQEKRRFGATESCGLDNAVFMSSRRF